MRNNLSIPLLSLPNCNFLPSDLFGEIGEDILSSIYITEYSAKGYGNIITFRYGLALATSKELLLAVPGIPDVGMVLTSPRELTKLAELELVFSEKLEAHLAAGYAVFRLPKALFTPLASDSKGNPVRDSDNGWQKQTGVESRDLVIQFPDDVDDNARASALVLHYDSDGGFDIECGISGLRFTCLPVEIGNTGIALQFRELDVIFEGKKRGIFFDQISVYFASDLSFVPDEISLENGSITKDGFSGRIGAGWDLAFDPDKKELIGDAAGYLFGEAGDGIGIGLSKFELEFNKNQIVGSDIQGQIIFPFFEKPVEVDISFDLKGNLAFSLRGTGNDALVDLTKEDLFSLKVNSFNFTHIQGKETSFALGGSLKPLYGDIKWPEIGITSLRVIKTEREWAIKVEGGWIEMEEPLGFKYMAFSGELSKIGFGSQGKEFNFIGFSGAMGLVSGIGIAAAFDDLKLIYPSDPGAYRDDHGEFFKAIKIELKRASVALIIPESVALIGEVMMREGGIGAMLDVSVIPAGFRLMAGAEFGCQDDYTWMQIMMLLELPPPGIPLGSTPVAILGFEGKFAMNMLPSMEPGWTWAVTEPKGIKPLCKMVPGKGGLMLGAGIKIASTDGTMVAVSALFALLLPGPVVMIEGRGAILTAIFGPKPGGDPPFYALLVINGKEQYFSANLGINADLAKGVVSLNATMGMFFDFQRPSNWWIKVGEKEPANKRVQAVTLKAFKALAYFELTKGPRVRTGLTIPIDEKIGLEVGSILVKAILNGDVDLSWSPEHAVGTLEMIAEIALKVCGFGLGLSATADVHAQSPYKRFIMLDADYNFFLNLPWPLPNVEKSGKFKKKWEDGDRFRKSFAPLIAQVSVDSETPGTLAQALQSCGQSEFPKRFKDLPVVTLDARPNISFKYPVNDDTDLPLAVNTSNGEIWHEVGNQRFRFALKSLKLEKVSVSEHLDRLLSNDGEWMNFVEHADWEEVPISFGVWLAGADMTGKEGATHLRLWSRTPFTHFRQKRYTAVAVEDKYFRMQELAERAIQTSDLAWLTSDPTSGHETIQVEDVTHGFLEAMPWDGASHLSELVEEESPDYPLGKAHSEWYRVGFSENELVNDVAEVEAPHSINVIAVPCEHSLDVIDVPFLLPYEQDRPYHRAEEMVRGVFFQGGIKVTFPFPTSDCELYLYPISRREFGHDELFEYTIEPPSYAADEIKKYKPAVIVHKHDPDEGEKDLHRYNEKREIDGDFYVVRISRTTDAFCAVTLENKLSSGVNDLEKGLLLVAIGYRIDVEDRSENGKQKVEKFNDNAWGESAGGLETNGILDTRCCYRLVVTYEAGRDDTCTEYFYFRTDGPPSSLKNCVAWPIPSEAEYPVFRDYSVGIHFNSNYVSRFYENTPLELRVQGSDGRLLSLTDGELSWKEAQSHQFTPEEAAYIDCVNNSGVTEIDPSRIPKDLTLVANNSTLSPDEAYTVSLELKEDDTQNVYKKIALKPTGPAQYFIEAFPAMVTASVLNLESYATSDYAPISATAENSQLPKEIDDEIDQSLYSFSFRTSKYVNFQDMIEEKNAEGTVIKVLSNGQTPSSVHDNLMGVAKIFCETWAPLKSMIREKRRLVSQRLVTEEELVADQDKLAAASLSLDSAFDETVRSLDSSMDMISIRALPRKTTLYYSRNGMILELSEPLDSSRLEISAHGDGASEVRILTACNSSETRFLIFPAPGEENPQSVEKLEFKYNLDIGDGRPRFYLKGDPSPESACIRL